MSDQFNDEPLEKFFHDHLDQYGDEPGQDFWDKLEPKIPPPPKKRYPLPIWWLLGIGTLLLVGIYFWNKERAFQNLSQQVITNQEQIEALKNTTSAIKEEAESLTNNALDSERNTETSNAQDQSEENIKAQNKSNSPLSKQQWLQNNKDRNTTPALAKNREQKKDATTASENSNSSAVLSNTFSVSLKKEEEESSRIIPGKQEQSREGKINKSGERVFLDTFNTLDLKLMELKIKELELEIKDWGFDSLNLNRPPKRKIMLGVFYENWFQTKLNHNIQANSSIEIQTSPSYDPLYRPFQPQGRSLGISIGIPIKRKWKIQTGLGWAKMELEASGDVELMYNKIGAFEEPNNYLFNTYEFGFKKALGISGFSAEIGHQLRDMPEDNPPQDSSFTILFSAIDKNDYLHLPLHLEYGVEVKRFNFNLGLGVDVFQLLKSETATAVLDSIQKIEAFDGFEFTIRNQKFLGEPGDIPTGLRRTFIGGRTSLGMDYQLYKRWYLRLNGAYHFGLTPVTKIPDPAQNDIVKKANLNYWLGRIGIQYQF